MTDVAALWALLESGVAADRAFIDGMVRLRRARTTDPGERAALEALHAAVQEAALRSHADVRAAIAAGALRGPAARERFDAVPPLERDHFVEEVLGIAYPPLDEPPVPAELIGYTPSGYDEIVHAFGVTGLGPGDRLLDLGSGLGKVVLLAELLTGAGAAGVEREGTLCERAGAAAKALGLNANFLHADARDVPTRRADVIFMYLPFTGSVLKAAMARLIADGRRPRSRRRFLCAGRLDGNRYPELVAVGEARSWLNVYTWR